jgi:predicted DNA-binding transcriptional regulator AlpA
MSENPRRLLTTDEASDLLRLQAQTLRKYRSEGGGPGYVRLSANRIAYDPMDLAAWIAERRRVSTSDPGPGRAA